MLCPGRADFSVDTMDRRIQRDDEFSDSDDEGTGGRRDRASHKRPRRTASPVASASAVEATAPPPPAAVEAVETATDVAPVEADTAPTGAAVPTSKTGSLLDADPLLGTEPAAVPVASEMDVDS